MNQGFGGLNFELKRALKWESEGDIPAKTQTVRWNQGYDTR